MKDVGRMERDYETIGAKYRSYLVFDYKERMKKLKVAIEVNQQCLTKMAGEYSELFRKCKLPNGEYQLEPLFVLSKDISKMRSTIKQFVREWAAEVTSFLTTGQARTRLHLPAHHRRVPAPLPCSFAGGRGKSEGPGTR
eukprot:TRINITY_DN2747_c0_g1_i22.p2 TRINITY_DN2747_c0_g1~~TRINITY_DN2747_c0_g1_i22.p2  ORF type:complete len:139 (-),score=26.87 TRINITY_DN2747_c0_g1_i22:853-1269(-)